MCPAQQGSDLLMRVGPHCRGLSQGLVAEGVQIPPDELLAHSAKLIPVIQARPSRTMRAAVFDETVDRVGMKEDVDL
jgi:hypothetical protein